MNGKIAAPELTRLYLLGELDTNARRQLEETLMVDERSYEELLIAEDELIDSYLSGGLNQHEQEKFLQHFLITPERRQKLDFARTLRSYVTNHPAEPPTAERDEKLRSGVWSRLLSAFQGERPALGLTFAALALLAVLAGSWLIWKSWRQPEASRRTGDGVLLVSLSPNVTRSEAEVKRIVIPQGVGTVRLQLERAVDGYESYSAKLLTDEGAEVFRTDALRAERDGAIVVALPAELLTAGDYRLKLDGSRQGATEGAGTYYFSVADK
jgi:hypothetical protein